jgi:hypothetical protein
MSALVLVSIVVLASLSVRRLRRIAASTGSDRAMWGSIALCLGTPTGFLVSMNTGAVPSTPTNLAIVLAAVIYLGVIQCYRIYRDSDDRRRE